MPLALHWASPWPPPGVEVERLSLLHVVEDGVHVPVREEDAPAQQVVHGLARRLLDAVEQGLVNLGAAEALCKGEGRKEGRIRVVIFASSSIIFFFREVDIYIKEEVVLLPLKRSET